MGRKNSKKVNPFAKRKRDKKNQPGGKPDRRSEPYAEIIKENEAFFKYYKAQKICDNEEEWNEFLTAIRSDLPTTFRITGYKKGEAKALLDIIKSQFFDEYYKAVSELHQINEEKIEPPICLSWYPDNLAWKLKLSRKHIRRSEPLYRLHNFLISETNAGSISRQEEVSMIPPLVLDVKPTDKVLDMCAAPGSKTAQLIEALHSGNEDEIPEGFVVANDVDNNRCYMLVHQAKRMNSPCFVVTNHDASYLPNFLKTKQDGNGKEILKFDKILCDVPCSGDGTLRKNPDIWTKWNTAQGNNLHGVQYRVVKRGAELLNVGGRLVYSTCSLNPVENEAVLQRIIKDSEGALEIIDASHLVPGLKYKKGLLEWQLASKDVEIFKNFDEVPEKYHTIIRPTMFPLPKDEIKTIGLEKCIRVLPHFQDSGAFFVAVIEKKRLLPWEKNDLPKEIEKKSEKVDTNNENSKEEKSVPWGPQRKKRRLDGYKEDPYVFFKDEDKEIWESIRKFYDLNEKFNMKCLLTRCHYGKKKNIYFCSNAIKDLVECNENDVKIINTGIKTFARCDNKYMKCAFRLAQEGLQMLNSFIGSIRRIRLEKNDLIKLLQCTDPTKPPSLTELSESVQERVKTLDAGSCILEYFEEKFSLFVVGWRGTSSLRAYTDNNDSIHMLRLLEADLSMFEVNKFKKNEEDNGSENVSDPIENIENQEEGNEENNGSENVSDPPENIKNQTKEN